MEIERKWRLVKLPDCCINNIRVEISQGYLFDGGFEFRIRHSATNKYIKNTLTAKGSGHLAREEWETEIPHWVFNSLWLKIENSLEKDRFTITRDDYNFEFDEYKGDLFGLIILEIEFKSIEEANGFVLPNWVGDAIEVTEDPRFKNKWLARHVSLDHLKILPKKDNI
jgi:CYTH domain-containing protein